MRCAGQVLMVILLTGGIVAGARAQNRGDPLQVLTFLAGTWHGAGQSPYGPYEFEAVFDRVGRWLFTRSTVFAPGTSQAAVASGSVFGYDDEGLIVYAFGGETVEVMRVEANEEGVQWGRTGGDSWTRTRLRRRADGTIHSLGEIRRPGSSEILRFESVYQRGAR